MRLTPEQIDRWLERQSALSDEYPFCPERVLARRDARRNVQALDESATGLPPSVAAYLEESRLGEFLDALHLRPVERGIAEMRAAGCTVRDIVVQTGLTKWRVETALKGLRRRLRILGKTERGGATGWQEVYMAETHRWGG